MNYQQLDFINDWEKAERDAEAAQRLWKAKHDIIDQSPASKRVKQLLHALADFPRIGGERGVSHITVSIEEIGTRIGKGSSNTVTAWLKEAYATGYLELLNPDCKNTKRTYVIHWRSIFNGESAPDKRCSVNTPEDVEQTNKRCSVGIPEDGKIDSPDNPKRGSISK